MPTVGLGGWKKLLLFLGRCRRRQELTFEVGSELRDTSNESTRHLKGCKHQRKTINGLIYIYKSLMLSYTFQHFKPEEVL